MKAYSFTFQIYADHSQIYISDMNFSPKMLTCLPSASLNISTQISNSNFKLKVSKTELFIPHGLPLPHQAQPGNLASHLCLQTKQTVLLSNLAVQWKPQESSLSPLLLSYVNNHEVVSVLPLFIPWLSPSFSIPTSPPLYRPLLCVTESSDLFTIDYSF